MTPKKTPSRILIRGSLYNSYAVSAFYGAWALVVVGFQSGLLRDYPTPQRAAFLAVVTYWTTITVFGVSCAALVAARRLQWRYLASFVASVPPLYELTIYVIYPLTQGSIAINYLGLVLWAWLLPMVVLLVHWEHERLEWIEAGAGDPVLAVVPGMVKPTPRHRRAAGAT